VRFDQLRWRRPISVRFFLRFSRVSLIVALSVDIMALLEEKVSSSRFIRKRYKPALRAQGRATYHEYCRSSFVVHSLHENKAQSNTGEARLTKL
jgi:hypothetical protein